MKKDFCLNLWLTKLLNIKTVSRKPEYSNEDTNNQRVLRTEQPVHFAENWTLLLGTSVSARKFMNPAIYT